jgi:hypothetical protein
MGTPSTCNALTNRGSESAGSRVVHVDQVQPQRHVAQQPLQGSDLVVAGVHALHQHPGHRQQARPRCRVRAQRVRHLCERPAPSHGEQLGPTRRDPRRQRHDQAKRVSFGGVAADGGEQPHRRDRDRLGPNPPAAGIAQDLRGPDDRVVVVQRLSLPHEHRAGHPRPVRKLVPHGQERRDHLPGPQVAAQAQPPRRAEHALHRAAHLAAQAHRERAGLLQGDPHRLGQGAVRRAEQVLHEAVVGILDPIDDLEPPPLEAIHDLLDERSRQRLAGRERVVLSVADEVREQPTALIEPGRDAHLHQAIPQIRSAQTQEGRPSGGGVRR